MVMEEMAKPAADVPPQARPVRPARQVADARAGHPSCLPPSARGVPAQPAGPGAMAGLAREPADGPGRGQPDLAAPFRHGTGEDGRELRRPGRAAVAPRAARLAGHRAGPHRLGRQGDAPADRHQRDLSPGVARAGRAARSRPGEPPAGARAAVPALGRGGARQCPGDRRAADAQIGGPSVKPYQPAGLWEELAGGAGEGPYIQDKGPDLYRRSLYVYRKRTVPHPALATFDAPSRETCQVKRPRTNTPLQALELLNDVAYVEAARRWRSS